MKIFNLMILAVLLSTTSAEAAKKPTKMTLKVSYGEKSTVFEIPDAKKLEVVVNGRKRKTLRGNIDHAIKLATAASKTKSNDKALCRRKHIELTFSVKGSKETRTYGCIDSKTPAAIKLTELSNLMLFM